MRVRKILALAVVALAEPIDRALIDRALLPIDRALLPNARDEHRRRCAQKCAAQGRAMIFALHTRKAGGSSIREYLASEAMHHLGGPRNSGAIPAQLLRNYSDASPPRYRRAERKEDSFRK